MSKSRTTTANSTNGLSLAQMRRAPTHPGEMFAEEYRKPSGISQAAAARAMGISTNRLNEIELGKRAVSAETAVLFGAMTKTDPEFWATLQARHDVWHALQAMKGRRPFVTEQLPARG